MACGFTAAFLSKQKYSDHIADLSNMVTKQHVYAHIHADMDILSTKKRAALSVSLSF